LCWYYCLVFLRVGTVLFTRFSTMVYHVSTSTYWNELPCGQLYKTWIKDIQWLNRGYLQISDSFLDSDCITRTILKNSRRRIWVSEMCFSNKNEKQAFSVKRYPPPMMACLCLMACLCMKVFMFMCNWPTNFNFFAQDQGVWRKLRQIKK